MGFENGKIVRVTLRAFAPQGQEQVNTFHYDLQDVTGVSANDPQTLADLFRDDVRPHFAGLYIAAWSIDQVVVQQEKDPQNPNAGRQEWVSGSVIAGTYGGTGEGLPHAMCAVAKLKTEHIGRRHTGRLFLGGHLFEGDLTNGVWAAANVGYWDALLASVPRQPDIATGVSGSTAHWCVYSRTQRGQDLDPYASKITSATVSNRVHWLRSRDE